MAAAATDEAAEVAALDRVLTRTVLTKDEDLQTVRVCGWMIGWLVGCMCLCMRVCASRCVEL